MAQNGKLELDLQDVFDKRIQEKVDISLRNLQLSHAPIFRNVDASTSITIGDLFTAPQGNYQQVVDPPSYNPVNNFVLIKTTGVTEKVVPSGGYNEDSTGDFPCFCERCERIKKVDDFQCKRIWFREQDWSRPVRLTRRGIVRLTG